MTVPRHANGWIVRQLSDIAVIRRGRFSARPRNDPKYYGGTTPFIQTGDISGASKFVRSFTQTLNSDGLAVSKLFPKGTLVMTIAANIGDMALLDIDAAFPDSLVGIVPKENVCVEWLFYALQNAKNDLVALAPTNTQANLNIEKLEPFRILTPPEREQRRIATVLSTWDESLERLSRQIARKEQLFSSIREMLVHCAHRICGGSTPCPLVALSDVTRPLTGRNGGRFGREFVMGVTKANGIVPMREHVVAEDISRYLILPPKGFAYNPMRINIGSIAMSEHEDDVIVSPDYVVFACDENRLHPRFLNHLRRTKAWADFMTIAGNGSVRVRIYYANLAEFEFHLPPLDEQLAIVEVLNDAEREIATLNAECAAITKQRDALATELLTGRIRVPHMEIVA